jgi:hypothetical protein
MLWEGRDAAQTPARDVKPFFSLRVVGDYLDRHRAVAFDISWTSHSVTVKYQTPANGHNETNFTIDNLHDLGVGMYLRRSSRRLASRPAK